MIKSVSSLKLFNIITILKNFRDFEQELLLNYLSYYYFVEKRFSLNNMCSKSNLVYNSKLLPNNSEKKELGHYLAGLIESDGSIIIPKENSKNTPTISISFHKDDKPLAIIITNKLYYGSVQTIEVSNAVQLSIRGKYSILDMVSLINGKFRTPKREKLKKLISYINNN